MAPLNPFRRIPASTLPAPETKAFGLFEPLKTKDFSTCRFKGLLSLLAQTQSPLGMIGDGQRVINVSGSEDAPRDGAANETIAVALQYDRDSDSAPKVIAGGRGAVAEQILQIAFAQGVRVREDADLAQMLSAIDLDSEIPVEAFAAVAEILVYVYRANGMALPLDDLIEPESEAP